MKKYLAEIKLKSDLCVGSGYSYAGVIDTDICYTDYGLPYIPSRRLKGCLKEAAEMICLDDKTMREMFGERGNNISGAITLSNAYLIDNKELEKQLDILKNIHGTKYFDKESVLNQFTKIKAQTAIDKNGKAKNNTLRFIRVINHYDIQGNENVFSFEILCDEIYEKNLNKIFKALRHIGMDRNRGLGSIVCTLKDSEIMPLKENNDTYSDEEYFRIDYSIKNIEPLMLSNDNDSKSESHISGQSVLGFFAKILQNDEDFEDYALNGTTIYSNLYPLTSYYDNGNESTIRLCPVPEYINRTKKSKELVNVLAEKSFNKENKQEDYGNQPKKLNDYYYVFVNNKIILKQPELDVAYHHSKRTKENPKGLLYSLTKLKENQKFSGYIITKGKHVKKIVDILQNNDLYFGKSKSAQYGKCILENIFVNDLSNINKQNIYKAGETIVLSLTSDGIFVGDNSNYTVNADEVKKIIAEELNIKYKDVLQSDRVSVKYITGYNTMWNLKKPSFNAVKAGSYFVYELTDDLLVSRSHIGEKNHEGYGEFSIAVLSNMNYLIFENPVERKVIKEYPKQIKKELINIVKESLYNSYYENLPEQELKINSSLLGRVTLMVKQSKDKEDLMNRIDSIKTKSEKDKIRKFISQFIGNDDKSIRINFQEYEEYEILKKMNELAGIEKEWKKLLIRILTQIKYKKLKSEKNGGNEDEEDFI